MKYYVLWSIVLFSWVSCRKESHRLEPATLPSAQTTALPTVPEHAYIKFRLSADSTEYDETSIVFRNTASPNYVFNEDALYMKGFGTVSLASISADQKQLAINTLPFTANLTIPLEFTSKKNVPLSLGISAEQAIPASVRVWIRDAFLKDSTDISAVPYVFETTTDTNSYGSRRLVLFFEETGK